MNAVQQAAQKLRRWREDPVAMVVEEFGVTPDPQQAEILRAFPTNQRLGMKASKGPGKTAVLSWCAWNFLATRPYPKIAATSVTWDNLSDGLWAEMAKWQERSKFLKNTFAWTKTRIFAKDHSETWFMSARSWSKTASAEVQGETLAGLHADYMMFIIDESGGCPDAIMAAAEAGLATGIECKLLQAGNPTHLEGPLYRMCTSEKHLWFVVEMTGDPDSPMRSPRVNEQWAREQIEKYGRDNPWVLVNVFGQFPPVSINALLGPEDVARAQKRIVTHDMVMLYPKVIGIDVARGGAHRTVIQRRRGMDLTKAPITLRTQLPNVIAGEVIKLKMDWEMEDNIPVQAIFIDDTGGWAIGVIDRLESLGHSVIPVQFAGAAQDPRYYNKRAEIHFRMADWVKKTGAIYQSSTITRELTAPTYTFRGDKMLLEDKEQIEKRIGVSPDEADGAAVTFAEELPMLYGPQDIQSGTSTGIGKVKIDREEEYA